MEANGGQDHAPANGVAHGPADHALANGVAHGLANHALANGVAHGLAEHALANGVAHGLANGGGHALANGGDQVPAMEAGGEAGNGGLNPALYLAFLYLPAQEIARCRAVCRPWLNVTDSENFRRRHHQHHSRTPMPLCFFQDSDLVRINLRAVDVRGRVTRPVLRFPRPPSHEAPFRVHGSCGGVLLLSSGAGLYACNPCTRRWAHLPPLHLNRAIVGFYVAGVYHGDFRCHVLYRDRREPHCAYSIFTLAAAPFPATYIGRSGYDDDGLGLDLALAKGILPSYKIPPVFVANFLHWLPQAARDNSNVIVFDTFLRSFAMIPPPAVQVNGEDVPVVGGQLFGIDERLAMTVISPANARVDVWVRCNVAELWILLYRIILPVDEISLNEGYLDDGTLAAGVFAVAQDRSVLVQCPRVLLQCDALGSVLQRYRLDDHWTFLSGHTIEESLLLHPSVLLMPDGDAVDGDPPFFQNQ